MSFSTKHHRVVVDRVVPVMKSDSRLLHNGTTDNKINGTAAGSGVGSGKVKEYDLDKLAAKIDGYDPPKLFDTDKLRKQCSRGLFIHNMLCIGE